MNRWSQHRAVKSAAFLAALALAFAPVDLLAVCGCSVCGCAAAAEDSSGCCCTGKTHVSGCCGPAASSCCQPAATPTPGGCSCTQSAPAAPTGTVPTSSRTALDTQAHLAALAIRPPIAPCDSAFSTALFDRELHQAVPARVLFCVWRI